MGRIDGVSASGSGAGSFRRNGLRFRVGKRGPLMDQRLERATLKLSTARLLPEESLPLTMHGPLSSISVAHSADVCPDARAWVNPDGDSDAEASGVPA